MREPIWGIFRTRDGLEVVEGERDASLSQSFYPEPFTYQESVKEYRSPRVARIIRDRIEKKEGAP